MPTMSRSDQPRVDRIRLTTTRTGAPARRSRSSTSPRASRVSPTGSAEPDDHDLVGDVERAEGQLVAARPGDEVAAGVVLEAEAGVDDDVTVGPRDLEQVLDDAGPHLDPAVGARQTGDDREVVAQRALHGRRSAPPSAPSPVSRAALSRPDTSSRTPSCWATEAA